MSGVQIIVWQLGGSLGGGILEPWLFGFLARGSFLRGSLLPSQPPPGGGTCYQGLAWCLTALLRNLPQRLPLRPAVAGRGGCVWLVDGYVVVLTHSSCNRVVTTPEHFLSLELPQVAPHLTT